MKYKMKFHLISGSFDNIHIEETIDLVKDYSFTTKEAQSVMKSDGKQIDLYLKWLKDHAYTGYAI